MSKKLNKEQIDDLFQFCDEQDVCQYDLKFELVDHLACSIEQEWEKNQNLLYEDALWQVFNRFGVSGFSKIRKEKEKTLRKKYRHLQWKYIGEFFKIPKIIACIAVTLFFYTLFEFFDGNYKLLILLMLFIYIYKTFYTSFLYPRKYQLKIKSGKTFILSEYQDTFFRSLNRIFSIPALLFVVFQLISEHFGKAYFSLNVLIQMGFSFSLSFFVILLYASSIYIPKRIKEDFENEFPQFVKT